MKDIKILFFVALLGLCACSNEDTVPTENLCTIHFSSVTVGQIATTRSGASDTYLPQSSLVRIIACRGTDAPVSKDYTISDATGTLTSSDNNPMKLIPSYVYNLYEYSPKVDFASGYTDRLSVAQGTDLLVANLMSTTIVNNSLNQTITFPSLTHKCSCIQLNLQCDASNKIIKSVSAGAAGVTFTGMTHSPQNYSLPDSSFNLASVAQDATVSIAQSSFTGTGSPSVDNVVVLPKASGAITVTIACVINGATYSLQASATGTFDSGKKYAFTVNFTDTNVSLSLSVANWIGINNAFGDVGTSTSFTLGNWPITYNNSGSVGTSGIPSVNDWTTNTTSSTVGGGSSSTTVDGWTNTGNNSGNMGSGGSIAIGTWTPITGNSTVGGGSGSATVGGWTNTTDNSGTVGSGSSSSGTTTVTGWTAIPNDSHAVGNDGVPTVNGWNSTTNTVNDLGS